MTLQMLQETAGLSPIPGNGGEGGGAVGLSASFMSACKQLTAVISRLC